MANLKDIKQSGLEPMSLMLFLLMLFFAGVAGCLFGIIIFSSSSAPQKVSSVIQEQIYHNDPYGFAVTIPKGWSYKECNNEKVAFGVGQVYTCTGSSLVYFNLYKKSLDDFVNELKVSNKVVSSSMSVSNQKFSTIQAKSTKVSSEIPKGYERIIYAISDKDKLYTFSAAFYSANNQSKTVAEQRAALTSIASSFKLGS